MSRKSVIGNNGGVLFTSFEPSGDDHAASVIAELRHRHPELPMFAWGGPRMREAGAEIVEYTGKEAVMGIPGAAKVWEHVKINRRIRAWLRDKAAWAPGGSRAGKRPVLHVPVDSPAANFPICRIAHQQGLRVMHLVAPQIWAWGPWRIRKLRRLTNQVLCLLPFEQDYFLARGVQARFIGHPLFDEPLDELALERSAAKLGGTWFGGNGPVARGATGAAGGELRLALMPGSRPQEIRNSFPVLLDAFKRLKADFPQVQGVVAVTNHDVARNIRATATEHGGWPPDLDVVVGQTDAAIRWCRFALVTSGTVTLQVARQRKPMVTFYKPSRLGYYLLGWWIVSTRFFTLPNLIAEKRIVPELIPHFGDGEDLAVEVLRLMRQPGYAEDQVAELDKVCRRFQGTNASMAAADAIERMLAVRV